ncbi:hypothetical protein PMIN07_004309 [Paraphaeosphaeria minitans]
MSEDAANCDNNASFAHDTTQGTQSPYAFLYAVALRGLDNPFAQFLKKLHGVSGTVKVGHASGIGSYSVTAEAEATEALQLLYRDAEHPRFKDSWARALTYRNRPLEEATPTNRADGTIQEVIQQAEDWVDVMYEAMCNTDNVRNKTTSIELAMFKSPLLDKKAVEAACRSILIALIHRCVVGFCGLRLCAFGPVRADKKLTCQERLLSVVNALKLDKRICKDVLTEDSKIFLLVHAPSALLKTKKSQEKGNDVKRDLLAAASAARRQAQQSTSPLENPPAAVSTSSSPAPDVLPTRETLTAVSLEPTPILSTSAATASPYSLPRGLSVLCSQGFATLNEERISNKRSSGELNDGYVNGGKRTRTTADTSGHDAQVDMKLESDDDDNDDEDIV